VFWPLVGARVASITALTLGVTVMRGQLVPGRNGLGVVALAGVFDAGGNALFALAAQAGRLDVAGVLSSLYPASTVALAWLILKERITRTQLVGIVAALIAIVLITAS
jgi:drug/metabolite transporter (DMT)-like permease